MSDVLNVQNSVVINASRSAVWDVLTNPEQTKKYMFGCETVSDWTIGSSLEWKALYEGKEMVFVKGTIKQLIPNELLEYSTIDPNSDIDDISENYLHVIYRLNEEAGNTILTVTQGDYSRVADGERRYQEAFNGGEGWNPILVQIKEIAETV